MRPRLPALRLPAPVPALLALALLLGAPALAGTDGDGVPDDQDNCVLVPNSGQEDANAALDDDSNLAGSLWAIRNEAGAGNCQRSLSFATAIGRSHDLDSGMLRAQGSGRDRHADSGSPLAPGPAPSGSSGRPRRTAPCPAS